MITNKGTRAGALVKAHWNMTTECFTVVGIISSYAGGAYFVVWLVQSFGMLKCVMSLYH